MPDVPLAVARTLYSLDLPAPLRIIRAVGDNVPDVRGRPRDLDACHDPHVVPLPSGGRLHTAATRFNAAAPPGGRLRHREAYPGAFCTFSMMRDPCGPSAGL